MSEKNIYHLSYDEFIEQVLEYNHKADRRLIKKAYDFAHKVHYGQKRASGEAYFVHPLNVALTLTKLRADSSTLAAGLLHDSVEDGTTTIAEIKKEEEIEKITGFGEEKE